MAFAYSARIIFRIASRNNVKSLPGKKRWGGSGGKIECRNLAQEAEMQMLDVLSPGKCVNANLPAAYGTGQRWATIQNKVSYRTSSNTAAITNTSHSKSEWTALENKWKTSLFMASPADVAWLLFDILFFLFVFFVVRHQSLSIISLSYSFGYRGLTPQTKCSHFVLRQCLSFYGEPTAPHKLELSKKSRQLGSAMGIKCSVLLFHKDQPYGRFGSWNPISAWVFEGELEL